MANRFYPYQNHWLGWYYLSTILDDFSRYVVAWKLRTTIKTRDVTETQELALQASGCGQVAVQHKLRLLSEISNYQMDIHSAIQSASLFCAEVVHSGI